MFELKRRELKTENGPCLHDHREQSQDVLVFGGVPTLSFSRMGRQAVRRRRGPMSRLNGRERVILEGVTGRGFVAEGESGQE